MAFNIINPAMLLGLAAVALPVLVHLLSRKKFDVVNWGAMQFLELGRRTKRRYRLEELLLLLMRIGIVGLLAFALARPWVSGGFLTKYVSSVSRDTVIIIDGSSSMGWEGGPVTPHARAIGLVHQLLETMQPGDTVALLDARDTVDPVVASPTSDWGVVKKALDGLSQPTGSSNLAEAITRGLRILAGARNVQRDVIVLTDGQARCWHADDANRWALIDDVLAQAAVKPSIWTVNVSDAIADQINFSLESLEISREFTAVGFPVRVRTKFKHAGGNEAISRQIHLEVDGQRLAEKTVRTPALEPGSEFPVEFEHRFSSAGSHVISVVLEDDHLPGDNRAEASVTVRAALPVLLIDGDPQVDAPRSETFFVRAALSAAENDSPLIAATVIRPDRLTASRLEGVAAVVLANVGNLTVGQQAALRTFVERGGGLLVSLGDKVHAAQYNEWFGGEKPLLPVELVETTTGQEGSQGTYVANASLELPLVAAFRAGSDGGFTAARFSQWWQVRPRAEAPKSGEADESQAVAVVMARFQTGDPFLLTGNYGSGRVMLMTAPIDADWSTLPAQPDFVPLLHEIAFFLSGGGARSRNVNVGEPLLLAVPESLAAKDYEFVGPFEAVHDVTVEGEEQRRFARLDQTRVPGVYTFRRVAPAAGGKAAPTARFVVNFDRSESDLRPLSDEQRKSLAAEKRVTFLKSIEELQVSLLTDVSHTELWQLIVLFVLAMLCAEVWLTRRLVQGGHEFVDESQTPSIGEAAVAAPQRELSGAATQ